MSPRFSRSMRNIAEISALVVMFFCHIPGSPVMAESVPFHLRIGFSNKAFLSLPKADMRIAVNALSQKIAKKSEMSAESQIYDSITDIEKDLKTNKLDLLVLSAEEFIRLKGHSPLEPVMITVAGKSQEVELLLLVRKDSGYNRITDLKNRTIALPSKDAQFGVIYHTWLETLIMKEGVGAAEDFFSFLTETRNASQAIMPVFFRKIDACVISDGAFEVASELNPQIAKNMKVVAHINRLAGGIIALRQDMPEKFNQKVRQMLTTLHEDQEGRQMLLLFQMKRLIPFRPEYLRGTEALYAEYKERRAISVRKR